MLLNTILAIVLSVSGVLSEQTWGVIFSHTRICALNGSSVDMRCTYSYPPHHTVRKTFWNTNYQPGSGEPKDLSQDPEYSHRVDYLGNQNSDCTFRINQLRKSDSGTFNFRFWTITERYSGPGVTLTVTDLQLMMSPDSVTEGQSVMLTCSTTCTLTDSPAFIWYRDGSPLSFTGQTHKFTASWEDAGSYSCTVRGYEHLPSPAVALNVRYPPKRTSVSVSPSAGVVEGSSVTLTCSSHANPPVQRYAWFKKNDTGVWQEGSGQILIVSNFTSWNSGQYYCESKNTHGAQNSSALRITVQGGQSLITAAAVGTAAILALVFLGAVWVRRRKYSSETGDRQGNSSPMYANVPGTATRHTITQGTDRDDGGDPLYSSVLPANVRNREENLYSTLCRPLPQSEDDVQYASVTLHPPSAAPRSSVPSVGEDCVLYSTVRN